MTERNPENLSSPNPPEPKSAPVLSYASQREERAPRLALAANAGFMFTFGAIIGSLLSILGASITQSAMGHTYRRIDSEDEVLILVASLFLFMLTTFSCYIRALITRKTMAVRGWVFTVGSGMIYCIALVSMLVIGSNMPLAENAFWFTILAWLFGVPTLSFLFLLKPIDLRSKYENPI